MKKLIMILICLVVLGHGIARADYIEVCGDVSGVWNTDTVIVTCEIRIPPGDTLIIEPGVKVLFWVYCKFIVDDGAVLRAIGTETDTILFDEYFPDNYWHGIRFISASDSCRLEYCHITHGWATGSGEDAKGGGVYCYNSDITIENCLIDSCSADGAGSGISCTGAGPRIINNSIIMNLGGGGGGGIFYESGDYVMITDNYINGNRSYFGGGISIDNCSNAVVTGNTILANQAGRWGAGIYYSNSNGIVDSNIVSDNHTSAAWGNEAVGSGVYCINSSPQIIGNSITGNWDDSYWGGDGAGIACAGSSNPTISGNIIAENRAERSSGGGVAIYSASNPVIEENSIAGNHARDYGGGIFCGTVNADIRSNFIADNSSSHGAGIFCTSNSNPTIIYNTLDSNNATTNGGAICGHTYTGTITHNIITNNSAGSAGGGIYLTNSNPIMRNNTFWNNSAGSSGGAILCNSSSPYIINSILYLDDAVNGPEIWLTSGSNPQVCYSDVQGGWFGCEGNIDEIPFFRDPYNGDFHLQDSLDCGDTLYSPCIDAGHPEIADDSLNCFWGLGTSVSDMGAYGGYNFRPVITSTDTDTAYVDAFYTYTVEFDDPDGPDTVITFENYPAWLTPSGYQISGTPSEPEDTSFVVIAFDGSVADTLVVSLTVVAYPLAFDLMSPAESDTVWDLSANLVWHKSENLDPEDSILYQVYYDTTEYLATAVIIDSISDTTFTLSSLPDDRHYYWTVKAIDTNTPGTWADDTLSFYTYLREAPEPFSLIYPENEDTVGTDTVPLIWHSSSDNDPGDSLWYEVQWSLDSTFEEYSVGVTPDTTYVLSELRLLLGGGNETDEVAVQKGDAGGGLIASLPDDTTLYWRVKAIDSFGLYTWCLPDSNGWSFNIYINDSPGPFSLILPPESDTSWDLSANLIWHKSENLDPEDSILYQVFYDTQENLSTADTIDGIADTTYTLSSLADDSHYYWTVKAIDTNTPGTWANDTLSFFTYLPEPPGPFGLIYPGGDTIDTDSVTLIWFESPDPDSADTVKYEVWLDTLSDMSTNSLIASEITGTTYNLLGLQYDNVYYWTVKAYDLFLAETWASDTLDFTTQAGCDYVVGDVNGSDSYNGLDITYGVAYLKGGNPPLCESCPLCPDWHYCGDVNGSCSYNGLDITYGVAYLKGGDAPIPCGDCPPLGIVAVSGSISRMR